jgi:hypothetical protein
MDVDVIAATRSYETWLASRIPVVRADLRFKHERMRESPFVFLRGTFYRWIERWPTLCRTIADAPRGLAVGDLHVENFGTWRDAEGRLIWGVNDVDEACELPTRRISSVWPPVLAWPRKSGDLHSRIASCATRFSKATPGPSHAAAVRSSWRSDTAGCATSPSASFAIPKSSGVSC